MTTRTLSGTHLDPTTLRDAVQHEVAMAQRGGWTVESVILNGTSSPYSYEISTSRLAVLQVHQDFSPKDLAISFPAA